MRFESGNWLHKLLNATDALNTINGGSVMPAIKLKKKGDHYEVKAILPSVRSEAFKVEVHANILNISAKLDILDIDRFPDGFMMNLSRLEIPFDVDIAKISASMHDGKLIVILPYNHLANGFHKEIKVDKR